eukprot:IDg7945t1
MTRNSSHVLTSYEYAVLRVLDERMTFRAAVAATITQKHVTINWKRSPAASRSDATGQDEVEDPPESLRPYVQTNIMSWRPSVVTTRCVERQLSITRL